MDDETRTSPRAEGWALFWQQTQALLVKNALVAWRNKAATFLQLFASFFFMFLVFAINQAINASLRGVTSFKDVPDPTPVPIPEIPSCSAAFYLSADCYDFIWSGNQSSPIIMSLVQNITKNNPGRPIDMATQTLGFSTPQEVDEWLLANPYKTSAALHFSLVNISRTTRPMFFPSVPYLPNGTLPNGTLLNGTLPNGTLANGSLPGGLFPDATLPNMTLPTVTIGYGLQANHTAKQQRGRYEEVTFKFIVPLQAAAEREISRYLLQDWDDSWTPSYSEFAHPATRVVNIVARSLAVFLFAACMFNFVIQMSNIVLEKETRVRQAMSTMGLLDSVYWLTWVVWEVGLSIISTLLLVCFGLMFQFDFFLKNGFGALYLTFFLFWIAMTSFAFFMSAFFRKTASANTIGFFVFIIGFILQLVVLFGFPYDKQFAGFWRIIFSLFPPNVLAIGLKFLGDATATPADGGINLSNIRQCAPRNPDCVITLAGVYLWLFFLFLIYLILAIYFDNIVPDVNGVCKPPWFFLMPSFWTGKDSPRSYEGEENSRLNRVLREKMTVDEDVAAEEQAVKQKAENGADSDTALSVRGLGKTFPAKYACCGCCGCCGCGKFTPAFRAVQGPWFEVEKETLLCLLGPNGAGKSTTINCLTGILPATYGDALIYGRSIRSAASMAQLRRTMGVCPQFDVLWERLSGREHLYLFARIKGLKTAQIPKEVESLLGEVRLEDSGSVRTGSYSGGMKRRLSVAISLIGNPSIVFLDEPTTGMDPVSRRYVWDIIERAKRGRAIVLTTHSMEEADILGDRIAIMAKGRLRCIGTSIHLKQRFGTGIIVTVGFEKARRVQSVENLAQADEGYGQGALDADKARVKGLFSQRLGVEPTLESKGYLQFSVPSSAVTADAQNGMANGHHEGSQLTAFFRELKHSRYEMGVSDIQLSLTTLDEVFLNIARMAELETAAQEGRFDSIVLSDGVEVKVPVGAERIQVPHLGDSSQGPWQMIVEWQQDEAGNLKIFNHSEPVRAGSAPGVNGSHSSQQGTAKSSGCFGKLWRKQVTVVATAVEGDS